MCTPRLKITSYLHQWPSVHVFFISRFDIPFSSDMSHRPILLSSFLGAALRTGPIVAHPCQRSLITAPCHSKRAVDGKVGLTQEQVARCLPRGWMKVGPWRGRVIRGEPVGKFSRELYMIIRYLVPSLVRERRTSSSVITQFNGQFDSTIFSKTRRFSIIRPLGKLVCLHPAWERMDCGLFCSIYSGQCTNGSLSNHVHQEPGHSCVLSSSTMDHEHRIARPEPSFGMIFSVDL